MSQDRWRPPAAELDGERARLGTWFWSAVAGVGINVLIFVGLVFYLSTCSEEPVPPAKLEFPLW